MERAIQKIRSAKYKVDSVYYKAFEKLNKEEKELFSSATKILEDLANELQIQADIEFENIRATNSFYNGGQL